MKTEIDPGQRRGSIEAPASKSECHRLFITAALGIKEVSIDCGRLSSDLTATADCLRALGADIRETGKGIYSVTPVHGNGSGRAELFCGESGSTLRFLLPVCGLLGREAVFHMEGRLPSRPLDALCSALCAHGMDMEKRGNLLRCSGRLESGDFVLPGDCSSQYISALLMTLPLLGGGSRVIVSGPVQSEPYIELTENILKLCGAETGKNGREYLIPGGQAYALPESVKAEGDYSAAAFFLCAGALSDEGISVSGLREYSAQGDRKIIDMLSKMGARTGRCGGTVTVRRGELKGVTLDASQVPDLVPPAAALMAFADGESRIINAGRLRLKESDRLKSTALLLASLGGEVKELTDGLIISGRESLRGGNVCSFGDHRIAMAAAEAACGCREKVIIDGAEAVQKSYPGFWRDFGGLEGGRP